MQKCSRVRKGNGVWWKGDFKRDLGLLGWVGIGKHQGGMGPVLGNLTFRRTGSILRLGQLVSILLLVITQIAVSLCKNIFSIPVLQG